MTERFHYDEENDAVVIEKDHTEEVNAVLDKVKREKELAPKCVPGLGYKVGTIPSYIIARYLNEFGVSYHEFMSDNTHIHRIMNNPEFKRFRVWEGRI